MNTATYCPEDNKLRLYTGRVPRDEYLQLRKQGWTSTPKQDCDFFATWSVRREDTALEYSGGILDDEDQSPQDRAADRAERFSGYLEKRESEALQLADNYDAGPAVHGYQSQAIAERRANRHDLQATKAVNQWGKAEYWQRRTAGVISNALHKSAPGVRMGRIKVLESEQRAAKKTVEEYGKRWKQWKEIEDITDTEQQHAEAVIIANYFSSGYHYKHPRPESCNDYANEHGTSLYSLLTQENDPITGAEACALWFKGMVDPETPEFEETRNARWLKHYELRLAYENQMLEAQGGRLASVDIEPGGFIGKRQIQKVNKSTATGRVSSVKVWAERRGFTPESGYTVEETRPCLVTLHTERLAPGAYRPPTDEERAAFLAEKKAAKVKRGVVSTINPTKEDAERLQAVMNAQAAEIDKDQNYPRKPGKVQETTQAGYSGSYKDYRAIREINGACKVRVRLFGWQTVESVIILTDKPQKPLPATCFEIEQKRATT